MKQSNLRESVEVWQELESPEEIAQKMVEYVTLSPAFDAVTKRRMIRLNIPDALRKGKMGLVNYMYNSLLDFEKMGVSRYR